jgi:hypothetical protein
MDRPQDLRKSGQLDHFAGLPARMGRRETPVVGGVPVLRRHNQRKDLLHPIRHGNHLVAVWHRQRAAGQEIVLQIDQDERFHDR